MERAMSSKLIIIFGILFIVGNLLGGIMESTYLTSDQLSIFSILEGQDTDGDGISEGVQWWNISFYTDMFNLTLKMLTWDYAFLQNELQLFRVVGFAISLGFFIPFMLYIASLISNLFSKVIGLGR